ncbi:MAG: ECF transporter S component [Oscillospiraceae bacterium]|jgi:uncharacterized membrane protein|nr:ECF transporter S component [Oscillospiraceae bacterium]
MVQSSSRNKVQTLVLIGVFSALVFALSYISIPIPVSFGDNTRIHLGNIMCLLAGVLFGPMIGGLSAGIGSMLYDFTNPLYFSEFWITFITKFAMGWVAGLPATRVLRRLPAVPRALAAGAAGQLVYIVLYLLKTAVMQRFVYGLPWPGVWVVVGAKALVSGFNGLVAVAACTVLAPALQKRTARFF